MLRENWSSARNPVRPLSTNSCEEGTQRLEWNCWRKEGRLLPEIHIGLGIVSGPTSQDGKTSLIRGIIQRPQKGISLTVMPDLAYTIGCYGPTLTKLKSKTQKDHLIPSNLTAS